MMSVMHVSFSRDYYHGGIVEARSHRVHEDQGDPWADEGRGCAHQQGGGFEASSRREECR